MRRSVLLVAIVLGVPPLSVGSDLTLKPEGSLWAQAGVEFSFPFVLQGPVGNYTIGASVEGVQGEISSNLQTLEVRGECSCGRFDLRGVFSGSGVGSVRVLVEGTSFTFPVRVDPDVVDLVPVRSGMVGDRWEGVWRASTHHRESARGVAFLEVEFSSPSSTNATGGEPLETTLGREGIDLALSFRPPWGEGRYRVRAHAVGEGVEGVSPWVEFDFAPTPPSTSGRMELHIPDEPTRISFTRDSVNLPGKSKGPGDPLITRFIVEDQNGLSDPGWIEATILRLGPSGRVPIERIPLALDPNLTRQTLEFRYNRSPLREGLYFLVLSSGRNSSVSLERNFTILDVRPTLLEIVLPRGAFSGARVEGKVVISDRNFGTGPLDPEGPKATGTYVVRIFRGSVQVSSNWTLEFAGTKGVGGRVDVDLGALPRSRSPPVEEKSGVVGIPLSFRSPFEAPNGTYRVSIYRADRPGGNLTLLGSTLLALQRSPTIRSIDVRPLMRGVEVKARIDPGEGVERASLRWRGEDGNPLSDPWTIYPKSEILQATLPYPSLSNRTRILLEVTLFPGNFTSTVPVEIPQERGSWRLYVDGVERTEKTLSLPSGGRKILRIDPPTMAPSTFQVVFRDWEGVDRSSLLLVLPVGKGKRVEIPETLPPGVYVLRILGERGEVLEERSLSIGGWVGLKLLKEGIVFERGEGRVSVEIPLEVSGTAPLAGVALRIRAPSSHPRLSQILPNLTGSLLWGEREIPLEPIAQGAFKAQARLEPQSRVRIHLESDIPRGVPPGSYSFDFTVVGVAG